MRTRMTLLFLALSLTLCPVFGATVKASLDRNRVDEGETVVLSVMASGDASATPDLAPLGTDFDVLNQNQSTTMRVVNGRSSSSRQWQIVLAPKRVGKLTVPALAVGSDHSESLTLDVLPAAEAAKQGSQRALLLEVEAEPRNPYVQGEVLYTVRVLSRIGLRDAQLSEPQAGDAIVERLGEDTATSTYRNGQQYQVVERRYAIFPQHSGELKIDPPVLTAQVPDQNRRGGSLRDRFFGSDPFAGFGRDPFAGFDSMFQQTRPVQVRARAVDLNVRPRSAAAGSPWLPARSISLAENWSPDPPVFHVGEPVTRSITIRARGLSPTQLPDLTTALPEGIKDYVDKALTDSQWHGDEIVSQKTFKTALVPSRQGSFTLPAVSLTWWDTQTDQARVATLPERTIEVLPAAAGQSATVPLPQQLPTTASPLQAPSSAAGDLPLLGVGRGLRIHSIAQAGYWPWIAVILAVAWVISTMGWWRARSRGKTRSSERSPMVARPNPAKLLSKLESACKSSDARQAREAALEWAAAQWRDDPPKRLDSLARRLDDQGAEILRALDRALYAEIEGNWDGAAAWTSLAESLKRLAKTKAGKKGRDTLPDLYPSYG